MANAKASGKQACWIFAAVAAQLAGCGEPEVERGAQAIGQVYQIELDPIDETLLPVTVDYHHPDHPDLESTTCSSTYCMLEAPVGTQAVIRARGPAIWTGCDTADATGCILEMIDDFVVTARPQRCGDDVCEGDEGPGSCPADCDPTSSQRCPRQADYSRAIEAQIRSGDWSVSAGKNHLSGSPSYEWSTQTLPCSSQLPGRFDLEVTIEPADSSRLSGGCLLFDHRSATDFKYACLLFAYNYVLIGHVTGSSLLGDYEIGIAELDGSARLRVEIDGSLVAASVNGEAITTRDFSAGGLNRGEIGLGGLQGEVTFDNLEVVEQDSCTRTTAFDNGTGAFNASAEDWAVSSGELKSESTNTWKIADLACGQTMPSKYSVETTMSGRIQSYPNGCLVFDYRGPEDFKYACNYGPRKLLGVARPGGRAPGYDVVAVTSGADIPDGDPRVRLEVDGQQVSMLVNGEEVVSHQFSEPLGEGGVGVGQFRGPGSYTPTTYNPYAVDADYWAYQHIRSHPRLKQTGECSVLDSPVDPALPPNDYDLIYSARDEKSSWSWDASWTPERFLEHWSGGVNRVEHYVKNYYDVFGPGPRGGDWVTYDHTESMACTGESCEYSRDTIVDHMHDGAGSRAGSSSSTTDTWPVYQSPTPPSSYECGTTWLSAPDSRVLTDKVEVDCQGGLVLASRTLRTAWMRDFGLTDGSTTPVAHVERFVENDTVARRTSIYPHQGRRIHADPITVNFEDDDRVWFDLDVSAWAKHSIPECADDFNPRLRVVALAYLSETGEATWLGQLSLARPGFVSDEDDALPDEVCPNCDPPFKRYTGAGRIEAEPDIVVSPEYDMTLYEYLKQGRGVRLELFDDELVEPVDKHLRSETEYPECDIDCRRDLEAKNGECCVLTWGGYLGHSSLECNNSGGDYYSYISKHPDGGNFLATESKWKCIGQDHRDGVLTTRDCNNCLDMAKVSEWLCDHKGDSYNAFHDWCTDSVLEAIQHALPAETLPTCPELTPSQAIQGCWWEVHDIASNFGVNLPGGVRHVMSELANNGCRRYECVLECAPI